MTRIRGAEEAAPSVGPPGASDQVDPFEVISSADRAAADEALVQELWHYAGYTLLSVLIFLVIFYCFLTDPKACIIAFGTGSPCCLAFPCIKNLMKYTDPSKIIQEGVNTYVPGIIVDEDGQVQHYEPSPEETQALFALINEFMTVN